MKTEKVPLAELRGVGSVQLCDCGSINLTLGGVTLHLDPDTFIKSSFLVNSAAERFMDLQSSAADLYALPQEQQENNLRFLN